MQTSSDSVDLLSDERQFLENLLNTRANFSLVIFGLAIAAAGTLQAVWLQFAVLAASTILSALLAVTIARVQWKLDLVIQNLPSHHPARMIDTLADNRAPTLRCLKRVIAGSSRRQLIGYFIPWATTTMLLAGAVTVPLGVFQVTTEQETAKARAELEALQRELRALHDSVAVIRAQIFPVPDR